MLDLRLPAPRDTHGSAWTPVALVVGALLLAVPAAALTTQRLDRLGRLDALMLALAGAVIAGWGVLQLVRGRSLLGADAVLRLDDHGVMVRSGDTNDPTVAFLPWPDLAGVEVAWWRIVPPYVDEPQDLPVLCFVATVDGEIALSSLGELTVRMGESFGMPPEAAALVAVLDPSGLDAVQQVQGWLAAHQPRVPVELGPPPSP